MSGVWVMWVVYLIKYGLGIICRCGAVVWFPIFVVCEIMLQKVMRLQKVMKGICGFPNVREGVGKLRIENKRYVLRRVN